MEELSILEVLNIIKKHLKYVILCIVGWGTVVSIITLFVLTPLYSSSTQILVNNLISGDSVSSSDIDANLRLINTYKDIIKSPIILDEVVEDLDLEMSSDTLSGMVAVNNQENSQVIRVEVTDVSSERAAAIANSVSETFQSRVSELMTIANVTIISSALPRSSPIYPNNFLFIGIGILIGLVNGVAVAMILHAVDRTVKDEAFLNEKLNWICLGEIQTVSSKDFVQFNDVKGLEHTINPSEARGRM